MAFTAKPYDVNSVTHYDVKSAANKEAGTLRGTIELEDCVVVSGNTRTESRRASDDPLEGLDKL